VVGHQTLKDWERGTKSCSSVVLDVKSAREIVLKHCLQVGRESLPTETVSIWECFKRIIAEPIVLDTDQPPFDRSMRDGYGVRAEDVKKVPVLLKSVGEIKAGDFSSLDIKEGEAVHIMTGAPVPGGVDAVVMVEHTERIDAEHVEVLRPAKAGDNIARQGSEHQAGELVIDAGKIISALELAVLATVGKFRMKVFRRPTVGILATGDELVEVHETPQPGQIRNSNSFSLYAQVLKCGGLPVTLETSRDNVSDLRRQMIAGLKNDVLLVSGGVSMGKYDLVEPVFKELGIDVHFESVSMRPGKPTVFATFGNRFVYGLPGNPVSTFVAFELFVKPVLNRLQGLQAGALCLIRGTVQNEISEKSGRTAFLPARVSIESGKTKISPISWKGSADIFSAAEANGFLVVPLETTHLKAGDEAEALMFDELEFESESQF